MDNEEVKIEEAIPSIWVKDPEPAATEANDEVKINILVV